MRHGWENNGEPDENGDIVGYVENDKGIRTSTFKAKTYKEVADKLLESQANANGKIARMLRPDRAPVTQPINPTDKTLTPADRMRLTDALSDPETVVEAVTEIVTSAQGGVAPKTMAQTTATMGQRDRDAYYRAEAEAFVADNPDYYPVQQNRDKLFATLKANGYDLTRNNLSIVFQTLNDQGDMIPWPEEENEVAPRTTAAPNGHAEPNPPPPTTTRPRSVSTGIRRGDASALPPTPTPRKRLTRAELEAMPRAEYEAKIKDPVFRREVDALGA